MPRPKDPILRDRLVGLLRRRPRQSSSDLARQLGVTEQTVRRIVKEFPARDILFGGRTRNTRYALARPVRGRTEPLSLFSVDESGRGAALAPLSLIEPAGAYLDLHESGRPVPAQSRDGWWDGMPYAIEAIRPQGYLGRLFAQAEHLSLGVSDDPEAWSDEDIVWVLSQRGSDVSGDLILGEVAYERWLRTKVGGYDVARGAQLPARYARNADHAILAAGGASSAAGEFPKFGETRDLDGAGTLHVLVKFSGASRSRSEIRWADLLVCEHLALEVVASLTGVSSPRSRILTAQGRTFIEVERFDRVGNFGRKPVCSLDAIQGDFIGARGTRWPELVSRLSGTGLVDGETLAAVERLWWFGVLIANSDMHLGNLSFHLSEGRFALAPAYDMLPMLYAPLAGGEVPPRTFEPQLPLPAQRARWLDACPVALSFWSNAADDRRISGEFRRTCKLNGQRLQEAAGRV